MRILEGVFEVFSVWTRKRDRSIGSPRGKLQLRDGVFKSDKLRC
jgi:hypothetical protein